jgi:AraC-like DNA-binding protein
MKSLSAPPWANTFRSDNLDEVRAFIGNNDGWHSRVARRDVPMGYSMYVLNGRHTTCGGSESAVEQTVRGFVLGPILYLAVPAGSTYRVGRRVSAPVSAAAVVMTPAGWEYTRTSPPGSLFAIEVQQRTLSREMEARRPQGGTGWVRRLEILELASAHRDALVSAAIEVMDATRPGSDLRKLAVAEGRVVSLVADLALRESVNDRPGGLAQRRANDLEGWIDAHVDEPITLGQLCQVVGVGARCLQKSFEIRRGRSPMRFVTERRLMAAHHRLDHATADTSVTSVALELGFSHLGRFAQMYAEVIGESPSDTLARRRTAAAATVVNR